MKITEQFSLFTPLLLPVHLGEIFGNNIKKQASTERRITSVKLFVLLITVIPTKMLTQSRKCVS